MKFKRFFIFTAIAFTALTAVSCTKNKGNNKPTQSTPVVSTPTVPGSSVPSTPTVPGSSVSSTPTTPVVSTPNSTMPSVPSTTAPTPSTPNDDVIAEENGTNIGTIENGTGAILSKGQINVIGCSGLIESGYVVYDMVEAATGYNIYLKGMKYSDFTLVDKSIAYTRAVSSSQMRTDLLGLEAGSYQVKLVPVVAGAESNATASIVELGVTAYDRSGYAHFNYSDGVGAYNDDGTLKDDAIVIYVTDENKDYVMTEVCEEYNLDMFRIPNELPNNWNNKEAAGIGWWLNNAQYTKATKDSSGNVNTSKTSTTYSSTGQTLGFYSVTENHPVVIRFVGTVTTPEGCTAYDSYGEGGTPGDNGNMARMKDLNNVTLEGVGVDAKIEGWGFHFMASDENNQRGKSFEARNLTFDKYSEDALGMEGTQDDSTKKLKASVERCWVHHCTFLPGFCANPAESDKAEGDGSCDFKRGQYYTMSYCYYEYCHKTNLIGSSDSSLQYNISFHHNYWYNCGSRIPLLRQANIHFYNNYVYGDINNDAADLSYVTSLRGNAYMYSENNYYEGCKQVFESGNSGAVAKVFGNSYVSCFKTDFVECSVTDAQTREQQLDACNCAYQGISYKDFDTNPNLFYYDVVNKQSDCYLTTAAVAREECIKFAGSYYRTILNLASASITATNSNKYTPTEAIDMSNGTFTATLPTTKADQVINGIMYNNVTGVSAGLIKFRGQGVTFMVDTYVTVTIAMEGNKSAAMFAGSLVKSNGEVMLSGAGTAILTPGIYYLTSCEMDGDTSLTSMVFEKYDSEEAKAESIEKYNNAYSNIPKTIEYTNACYLKIRDAINAYIALGEWKSEVSTNPYDAYNQYVALGVQYVEGLISAIGTVNIDSGNAITTARLAYDELMDVADVEVSNYSELVAAEKAFEDFAVESCINKISAIGTVTLDSKEAIDLARAEYNSLTESQKNNVINYSVLTLAEAEYTILVNVNKVDGLIQYVDMSSLTSMEEVIEEYNLLTSVEQARINDLGKLSNIKVEYTIALINEIGTVTNTSGPAISKASTMYETLTDDEKALITNYQALADAEVAFDAMIVEYTISWSSTTEVLSNKKGTTSAGFEYSANKFADNAMCIKKSSSHYIKTPELNTTKATLTLTAKMNDTNNADQAEIVCYYSDGTTEIKYIDMLEKKVFGTGSVTFEGKEISYITINGVISNTSKNLAISDIVVTYLK